MNIFLSVLGLPAGCVCVALPAALQNPQKKHPLDFWSMCPVGFVDLCLILILFAIYILYIYIHIYIYSKNYQKQTTINKTHKVHAPKFQVFFSESSEAQRQHNTHTPCWETRKPTNTYKQLRRIRKYEKPNIYNKSTKNNVTHIRYMLQNSRAYFF